MLILLLLTFYTVTFCTAFFNLNIFCIQPLDKKDDKMEKTQKIITNAEDYDKKEVSSLKAVGFQVIS